MKKFLLAGAFALALFPASAQDAASDFDALAGSPSEEATPEVSWGSLKWSGDQQFAWRLGAAENPTRTGGTVDGTVAGEYRLGDLKLVGAALVRDNQFVPGETALYYSPGAFRLGIGLQEFSWGVADARNPTDTLNARDYRIGGDSPRKVNPAVALAVYPADWVSLEAVYEPWKEASDFPKDFRASTQAELDASRAKLVSQGLGALLTGYTPKVTAEQTVRDLSRPVYGGRANFYLPGIDLSLSYLYDTDTFYTPVVSLDTVAIPAGVLYAGAPAVTWYLPENVDLVLKRIHRLGVNAKTTVDRFGLWFEGAYNITEDHEGTNDAIRNDKLAWTTGLDFSFGPSGAYYANLQYVGEFNLGYDAATLKDYPSDPNALTELTSREYMLKRTYRSMVQSIGSDSEALMNTATVSLKFPLADSLVTPTLSGAVLVPVGYDDTAQTRIASAFLKPEIDVMPADGVHLLLGADLAYGWVKKAGSSEVTLDTSTDKLGVYTPQNNVYIKVQYKWSGSLGSL